MCRCTGRRVDEYYVEGICDSNERKSKADEKTEEEREKRREDTYVRGLSCYTRVIEHGIDGRECSGANER